MTDKQDGAGTNDEGSPQPRKRKHRRATRPATGGDPSTDIPARSGRDDTDAGWAPDAPDSSTKHPAKRTAGRAETAEERWWREQRPPHWE